jgi:hypothetical protein
MLVTSGVESSSNLCQEQGSENMTIPAVKSSHVGPRCVKSCRRKNKGIDSEEAKGSNNLVFGTTVFIPRGTAARARSRPGKHFTRNNYWFKQVGAPTVPSAVI